MGMSERLEAEAEIVGRRGVSPVRVLSYVVLTVVGVFTLVPLVWLIFAAFRSSQDIFSFTFVPYGTSIGGQWQYDDVDASRIVTLKNGKDGIVLADGKEAEVIKHAFTLKNFRELFSLQSSKNIKEPRRQFGRYLLNSFFITSTATSVSLLLASLGGFALAKYRFRGKNFLLTLMLATMVIPPSVLLAPNYELLCQMGLMNSYAGILIPGAVGAFGLLLFRQAMLAVPDDLLEAARIDGCSELRIYWSIVMPIVRPMSGAFCLIAFMASWNNFLMPMIVLQSEGLFTVPIFLSQQVGQSGDNQYGLLMAGTLLGVLPPAVLFFILQKEFIAGLTAGAVKG